LCAPLAADDDEPVGAGLGSPDLPRPAEQLTHRRARAERDAREAPRRRSEPPEPATPEVGQPDGVPVVDVDGVDLRRPGDVPLAPLLRRRVIAGDLAGVPLSDPDHSRRVRPDPACALAGGGWSEDGRLAGAHVDLRN